jgi:hypothetical protein
MTTSHEHAQKAKRCACVHHKVVPIVTMFIALLFLLKQLGILVDDSVVAVLWPLLVGIAGIVMYKDAGCPCC